MTEPTQRDINVWRIEAETAVEYGGVKMLGQFDWPRALLWLLDEREKKTTSEKQIERINHAALSLDVIGLQRSILTLHQQQAVLYNEIKRLVSAIDRT